MKSQRSFQQRSTAPLHASFVKSIIPYQHLVGNIPYDASVEDLEKTLQLAGPFKEFRLKIDQKSQMPKGFGFCEYKDPDIASSALRNLNKSEINGRVLKVDFASDNKNGTNLKEEDVKYRDKGEVVNIKGEYLNSAESNVEEILNSLSTEQEQMLLYGLKDVYQFMERSNDHKGCEQMIENLAQDEGLLDNLMGMLERVEALQAPFAGAQGGIFHYQPMMGQGTHGHHHGGGGGGGYYYPPNQQL